jgi:hypothetical protein
MPGSSPQNPLLVRRLRILGIILGIGLLVWLSVEESGDVWVLIFSGAISALVAAQAWLRLKDRAKKPPYWLPLAGFLAGLLVTPLALLLMALKTGLHGHQGPDFSGSQILSVILRTPVWVISGLLTGLGLEILRRGKNPNPPGD